MKVTTLFVSKERAWEHEGVGVYKPVSGYPPSIKPSFGAREQGAYFSLRGGTCFTDASGKVTQFDAVKRVVVQR
jgi:hypothetical protein